MNCSVPQRSCFFQVQGFRPRLSKWNVNWSCKLTAFFFFFFSSILNINKTLTDHLKWCVWLRFASKFLFKTKISYYCFILYMRSFALFYHFHEVQRSKIVPIFTKSDPCSEMIVLLQMWKIIVILEIIIADASFFL